MNRLARVSVLMPVWNGARHLAATVSSILSQTLADFEFIVVDDGSTDNSLEVLNSFHDTRLQIFRHEKNRGVSAARNTCLDKARGEFLAFTAQDDVSLPNRLERQIAFLETHPETGFVGSAVQFINDAGEKIGEAEMPATDLAMRWHALFDAPARHSSLMVRASVIRKHALRYSPEVVINSDYDFILQLLRVTSGVNLPEALVAYRLHATNNSRVQRKLYCDVGAELALRSIQREFPDWPVSIDDVQALRKAVLNLRPADEPFALAQMKRGLALFLDLKERFAQKYPAASAITVAEPAQLAASSLLRN
jgi:glycosyltransferase involved in cell wall biosynthesis